MKNNRSIKKLGRIHSPLGTVEVSMEGNADIFEFQKVNSIQKILSRSKEEIIGERKFRKKYVI